jgi:hypothetical protein
MFEEERANNIFRAYLKLIIPSFCIGLLFGALLTSLLLELW